MAETEQVALVVREQGVELGTLRGQNASQLLSAAASIATPLAKVIEDRQLYSSISGRRFVRYEGWTTLAVMLGCTVSEVSVTRLEDGGYEAVVALKRIADGVELGRASAECSMDERTWANRAAYARRSMAITRAGSKVCRMSLGWVMVLSGFEGTPAEEMPDSEDERGEPRELVVTPKQKALLYQRAVAVALPKVQFVAIVKRVAGVDDLALVPRSKVDAVLEAIKAWTPSAPVPPGPGYDEDGAFDPEGQ